MGARSVSSDGLGRGSPLVSPRPQVKTSDRTRAQDEPHHRRSSPWSFRAADVCPPAGVFAACDTRAPARAGLPGWYHHSERPPPRGAPDLPGCPRLSAQKLPAGWARCRPRPRAPCGCVRGHSGWDASSAGGRRSTRSRCRGPRGQNACTGERPRREACPYTRR